MADPVATVEKIVKLGLAIKQAVDTVRKNEEVCREITKRVLRFSDILSQSQLQQTGMLDANPAMAGALEDLEETLERALELVTACQGSRRRSAIRRLVTARDLSRKLREVKDDILNQAMLALFAINTHTTVLLNTIRISVHGGHHPHLPRLTEDAGPMELEISHSSHSTDDVRCEHDCEENSVPAGCEAHLSPLVVEITVREFRFADLEAATNGFSDSNIVGRGGIATVYKGVLSDGSAMAIKKFRWAPRFGWEHTYKQLLLASKLEHRNIVKVLGYAQEAGPVKGWFKGRKGLDTEREYIWVEEYVPKGTVHEVIHRQEPRLDWSSLIRIIEGIAQGVKYLHEQRIVHLDLKPTNIVLDSHMNPKITDFEVSKVLNGNQMKRDIITAGTFSRISDGWYRVNEERCVRIWCHRP
ncbi:hypothetical protein BS78_K343200 [Paspalum vaginatum]|uniref:non-specific serine/threonine protein kinase n=1 Tax=Paspalum vaginatum TaxID=158149 RepID=A0A9W8CEN4_9POAL|nr:hypothetical protein BS78_K343200 [Paspalum vaginatum]KAJ1256629.1 hypothetical protein BS78_K343200 [Paspalum vaginatum]